MQHPRQYSQFRFKGRMCVIALQNTPWYQSRHWSSLTSLTAILCRYVQANRMTLPLSHTSFLCDNLPGYIKLIMHIGHGFFMAVLFRNIGRTSLFCILWQSLFKQVFMLFQEATSSITSDSICFSLWRQNSVFFLVLWFAYTTIIIIL